MTTVLTFNNITYHLLAHTIQAQNQIGWRLFLEGWIDSSWKETQHSYYQWIGSHRTGQQWAIALTKTLDCSLGPEGTLDHGSRQK